MSPSARTSAAAVSATGPAGPAIRPSHRAAPGTGDPWPDAWFYAIANLADVKGI